MLLVITIAVLVLAIIVGIITNHFDLDWTVGISVGVAIMSSAALAIELIMLLINYVHADSFVKQNQIVYDTLIYQVENHVYEDDDFGKKELYSEITDWNTDLARGKMLSNNLWVGIFYPEKMYSDFDYIDYKKLGG